MKSIITNTIVLIFVVIFSLYLSQNLYFSPYMQNGDINVYNIVVAGILLTIFIYSLIYLISFLGKKKIAYGKGEFPPIMPSVIHGLISVFIIIISLILHIFHILSFGWSVMVCIIILIIVRLLLH